MDKYSGSLAGYHIPGNAIGAGGTSSQANDNGLGAASNSDNTVGLDFEEAAANASVEEILVASSTTLLKAAIDTASGEVTWATVPDLAQAQCNTVAKSQMSGMLLDTQRVEKYREAIRACISTFLRNHQQKTTTSSSTSSSTSPIVLDVGAGTGLLSLIASEAGAKQVYAIEQWPVMANIAQETVKEAPSAISAKVQVICSHSAEVGVGVSNSSDPLLILPTKADIVISEIVDSALLGEGIIPALRDAYTRLLSSGSGDINIGDATSSSPSPSYVVPLRATVHAHLIHCEEVSLWQDTSKAVLRTPSQGGGDGSAVSMARKDWSSTCEAQPVAIPLHTSRVSSLRVVSAPFIAAEIDLTPQGLVSSSSSTSSSVTEGPTSNTVSETAHRVAAIANSATTASDVTANAVMYWWDLVLWEDATNKIVYSTAPSSSSSSTNSSKNAPWQDHWVQVIQPLAVPTKAGPLVQTNSSSSSKSNNSSSTPTPNGFTVVVSKADMALSFFAGPGNAEVWSSKRARALAMKANPSSSSSSSLPLLFTEPQPCTCGLHTLYSHERRWMLSDTSRTQALAAAVDNAVCKAALSSIAELKKLAADAGIDDDEDDGGREEVRVRVLDISDGSLMGLLAATTATTTATATATTNVSSSTSSSGGGSAISASILPEGTTTMVFSIEKGDAAVVHAQALTTEANLSACMAVLAGYSSYEITPEVVGMAEATLVSTAAAATTTGDDDGGGEQLTFALEGEDDSVESEVVEEGLVVEGTGLGGGGEEEEGDTDDGNNVDEGEARRDDGGNEEDEEGQQREELAYVSSTSQIDVLVAEPWFAQMATVPATWAAPAFWYRRTALSASGTLAPHVRIVPAGARLKAQVVQFSHLASIHGQVSASSPPAGFSHTYFNKTVKDWNTQNSFVFPVWQYDFTPISEVLTLASMDFTKPAPLPGKVWEGEEGGGGLVGATLSIAAAANSNNYNNHNSNNSNNISGKGIKKTPLGDSSVYRVGGDKVVVGSAGGETMKCANAVIFWVDFDLYPAAEMGSGGGAGSNDNGSSSTSSPRSLTTGPLPGNTPSYWRQCVRFLGGSSSSSDGVSEGTRTPSTSSSSSSSKRDVRVAAWLEEATGHFELYASFIN